MAPAKEYPKNLSRAPQEALEKAREYLLSIQHAEGFFWGELASNCTMEAEYVMLTTFLGSVQKTRIEKIVRHLLSRQRADGSFGQYEGSPGDLSTTTECTFALKLAGLPPSHPALQKAKTFILSKGGIPKTRIFTKIWLALFGEWPWEGTPRMPPELIFLPSWFPFNIYEFASWARATIVPMTILLTLRPTVKIPASAKLDELYPQGKKHSNFSLPKPENLFSWHGFFFLADRFLNLYEKLPFKPLRSLAIARVTEWIIRHQEADGSWGGIQPPWVYSLLALKALGYSLNHPVMKKGLEGFETFGIEEETTWRLQACVSPVWDTALACLALQESGLPPKHPALQAAARWLLKEEVRTPGDWTVKVKNVPPSGWAFEFENDWYPDIDDTACVLLALRGVRLSLPEEKEKRTAMQRAARWMAAFQCRNGGFAAFDKDNDKSYLAHLPFCDFGEVLDPPSVDVTAHVLEALAKLGLPRHHRVIRRALQFIQSEQEEDGSWFGRWGVNYIYGTGAVLPALAAIGERKTQPYIQRALKWLLDHQNQDGGWGESPASYVDFKARGRGESTPSQTAWALMGLLSFLPPGHSSIERGVTFLAKTQLEAGNWDEPQYTGTGFPGYGFGSKFEEKVRKLLKEGRELSAGFMINYHLYRNIFPLLALGRYSAAKEKKEPSDR